MALHRLLEPRLVGLRGQFAVKMDGQKPRYRRIAQMVGPRQILRRRQQRIDV